MRISVVGAGYVGLVTAVALAEAGNEVYVIEKEIDKLEKLKRGISPFFEPGLEQALNELIRERKIFFYKEMKETIHNSEIIFIAVGTPSLPSGEADLSGLIKVCIQVGKLMRDYKVIVIKSTVPVGTCDLAKRIICESQVDSYEFDIVSNPEFLREGTALKDAREPSRIILGCSSKKARDIMQKLYEPVDAPVVITDTRSSEMIKYASNAFLATKISFINEIANICDKVGADIIEVARGMGKDKRIGSDFLRAGIGYGGSCFPKDTKALIQIAGHVAHDFKLLKAVVEVNNLQWKKVVEKLELLLGDIKNKTITIWGLSFKPGTDDIREAPSILIIKEINRLGGVIQVYDPVIKGPVGDAFEEATFCADPYAAAVGSDAVILVTEWKEFLNIDWGRLKKGMAQPVLIDGRNVYHPHTIVANGFYYSCIGRPPVENRDLIKESMVNVYDIAEKRWNIS